MTAFLTTVLTAAIVSVVVTVLTTYVYQPVQGQRQLIAEIDNATRYYGRATMKKRTWKTPEEGDKAKAKLGKLAERINAEHRACQAAAKTALEHAMNAGASLLEARAECPYGTWQAWVDDNFDGSLRTAQIYMYLARRREEVEEEKAQSAALLSISEALHKLALGCVEPLSAPPELTLLQQATQQPAEQPTLEDDGLSKDVWQEYDEYLAKKYIWDQAELAVRHSNLEQP